MASDEAPANDDKRHTGKPERTSERSPSGAVKMRDSRKFRMVLIAIAVCTIPILMTYSLALRGLAKMSDLLEMAKWMGGALNLVFATYIGGVAFEKIKRP